MTENELLEAKRKLPCDYLRYYGKPRGSVTRQEMIDAWKHEEAAERHEEKRVKKLEEEQEYPDVTEDELADFIYLRACLHAGEKPMGDFEGDAKICADVMRGGGDIADMYKAGANAVYCACLSHSGLDAELQKAIIDHHVPF